MSTTLITIVLALGLGVAVVRRRSLAIALVAAQSLAIGVGALDLTPERSSEFLVAAIVLIVKAVALPALLFVVLRRTREPRLVAAAAGPLMRLAGAAAAALLAVVLLPPLGIGDERAEQTAVALVLVGISIVIARRPALLQLLGLIVAENGIALLAVSVPEGLPYVIELGALFDLALVVAVAAAFTRRIYEEFGTGDTELLRGLRD
ncbi:MAG TPA: NADH-quinone oxidoreductase subunit K [Solirubrobacter sp.]|nr:NADH-quinone oxidoreductase subunit K [Solirubrobacter sp.]